MVLAKKYVGQNVMKIGFLTSGYDFKDRNHEFYGSRTHHRTAWYAGSQ